MKLAFRFGNTGLPFVPGLGAALRMNAFGSRGPYLKWRDKTGWKETIVPVPHRKSYFGTDIPEDIDACQQVRHWTLGWRGKRSRSLRHESHSTDDAAGFRPRGGLSLARQRRNRSNRDAKASRASQELIFELLKTWQAQVDYCSLFPPS